MGPRLFIAALVVFISLATPHFSASGQQSSTPALPTVPPKLTSLPNNVLDAELQSARGYPFRLSDYSGKVLVVNLWATWVAPSRQETPELVKLQAHFWSKGVRVVGLSTEDPKMSADEVHAWVRNYHVQYRIGWAPPDVATILMQGRDAIPQTFVISRNGRILKRFVGFNATFTPLQFKEAIEEALKEKTESLEPN